MNPTSLATYLKESLRDGHSPVEVLERAMDEALNRCALTIDPHAALLAGPASRLSPDAELVLWVLFHVVQLSIPARPCPAPAPVAGTVEAYLADWDGAGGRLAGLAELDWREAVARSALVLRSDPHPLILASEISRIAPGAAPGRRVQLLGYAGSALGADVPQPNQVPVPGAGGPIDPGIVGRWIVEEGPEGFVAQVKQHAPDTASLWNGLWLAAGYAQVGTGGMLNPTHCVTMVASLQQLASLAPTWSSSIAVAGAMRIGLFGPSVLFSDVALPAATVSAQAWRQRARRPGADLHQLKFGEAVLQAPEAVAARVRGLCAVSRHFGEPVPDPRFQKLLQEFRS